MTVSRKHKVFAIVSGILCLLATLLLLIFVLPMYIDAVTTQPDPEATLDPVGVARAAYVIFGLIFGLIALVGYIPSIILGAIGLGSIRANLQKGEGRISKLILTLSIIVPIIAEALVIISIITI